MSQEEISPVEQDRIAELENLVKNSPLGAAMLEMPDKNNRTPLSIAAENKHWKVFEYLTKNSPSGAKMLETKNSGIRSFLPLQRTYLHPNTIRFFIINAPNNGGLLTNTMKEDAKRQIDDIDQLKKEIIHDHLEKEYILIIWLLENLTDKNSLVFTVANIIMQQMQILLKR